MLFLFVNSAFVQRESNQSRRSSGFLEESGKKPAGSVIKSEFQNTKKKIKCQMSTDLFRQVNAARRRKITNVKAQKQERTRP